METFNYIPREFLQLSPKDLVTLDPEANPKIYSNKESAVVEKKYVEFKDESTWDPVEGINNTNPRSYILVVHDNFDGTFNVQISGIYPLGKPVKNEAFENRVVHLHRKN